jgi:16S rRNA processing protein RimM
MKDIEKVRLGKINGLYGVQGWVKIFSYTSPIANILCYSPWLIGQQGQWQTVDVAAGRRQGKGLVAKLASCHDRDQAMALLGAEIAIYRTQLPPPQADEYYWVDLIGLTVLNRQGLALGQVDHLIETGANDVLVVKGEKEYLIPFLREQVILKVDLSNRLLQVDWDATF